MSFIGKPNKNPILDMRTYQVELSHGQLAEVSTNVIALNRHAMYNMEGNQNLLLLAGLLPIKRNESPSLDQAYGCLLIFNAA